MKRRQFLGASAALIVPSYGLSADGAAVAVSGDRFSIGSTIYQIADVLAPSAYTLGEAPEPYVDQARDALAALLRDRSFDLVEFGAPSRWGVRPVRARDAQSGKSLDEGLVEKGCARVAPQTDDVAHLEHLLRLESEARAKGLGLWAHDHFKIAEADQAATNLGRFAIVEGRVVRAAPTRSRVYLNFGEDFRKDFTVSARAGLAKRWAEDGFDLSQLSGVRVRARGFMRAINGPAIEARHRMQLERLDL